MAMSPALERPKHGPTLTKDVPAAEAPPAIGVQEFRDGP